MQLKLYKKDKNEWFGIAMVVMTILSIIVFISLLGPYQKQLVAFSVAHPVLAPIILILWRFVGVVIPPLPGGLLAYALIPVLGWFLTFLYSTVGLLAGACLSFYIARKYREPVVKHFVPLQSLQKWESKLSEETELWGFLLIRMTTGPIMDFISYLAGLSKISFKKFFIATLLSLLPSGASYYLGEKTYRAVTEESPLLIIVLLVLVCGILVYLNYNYGKRFRKRT